MNREEARKMALAELAKAKVVNPMNNQVALLSNMTEVTAKGKVVERWDVTYYTEQELKSKQRLGILESMGLIANVDLAHEDNKEKCEVVRLPEPKPTKQQAPKAQAEYGEPTKTE